MGDRGPDLSASRSKVVALGPVDSLFLDSEKISRAEIGRVATEPDLIIMK
jgi:hypothetical protein